MTLDIICKKKPKKKGPNIITPPNKPRTWKAVSDVITKADVINVDENKDNQTIVLSLIKLKDSEGNQLSNFHLFPNWNMMFENQYIKKDLLDFFTILKDTLLQENPLIRIDYRCGQEIISVRGRIIGFAGSKSDDGLYVNNKKSHNCHIYVKLNKKNKLPKILKRFQVIVSGNLLDKNRYVYGFCNRTDGRMQKCTDIQYIKNIGNIFWAYGVGRCKAYDLNKGNPNQYCRFRTGT